VAIIGDHWRFEDGEQHGLYTVKINNKIFSGKPPLSSPEQFIPKPDKIDEKDYICNNAIMISMSDRH